MNLTKSEFEATALFMIERSPYGFEDDRWTVHTSDDEFYVRWSNGLMDRRHREFRAYVREGKFYYI
jgi:hypothetical protein